VFLLHKEITKAEDALGGETDEELEEVELRDDLPFDARLFVRRPPTGHPWWETFLARGAAARFTIPVRTAGAILIVRAQKHLFAFTFGTGRFSLDPSSYERDFGLRVTLNAVDPRSLRSVDMQTVEELTILRRVQASRRSGLEVFQLDEVRDMLRGVVGEPTNPTVALGLAGSDRLAFRARVRLEDLPAKCAEFLALYTAKTYKQNFGFIDYMRRVSEPDLLAQLDDRMLELLNKRKLTNVHLAPPEPVEWQDFGGFRYETVDRDGQRDDLDVTEFLDAFAARTDEALELKDLRRRRVVLLSAASGDVTKHWSVYDTIVAELEWGTSRYVLSGGDWFEIDKTFAAATAQTINELTVSTVGFPTSPKGEIERAYLERAIPLLTQSEGIAYALLDRELVASAGAPSLIEVCDIFSQLGQFIHVKRRTASATLSHLFAQGTVSAAVFMNDQAFRQAARAKLPAQGWDGLQLFPDDAPAARDYSVIYAVIAPGQEPLAKILPFLSQVSLTHAARTLRTMGFELELAHIEETAAP
jgi:uncharacterized protein (TIGR04141 family)